MNLTDLEIEISKYILKHQPVHYSDLESRFKISKPTISKSLNNIENYTGTLKSNSILVRDRKDGIYFQNDIDSISNYFEVNSNWHPVTPKDRRMYILASLLFQKRVTTIPNLVQELYVTQRTIENDLVWIRSFIADNNGKLINNSGSLKLSMSKDYLYAFMIYVFHDYWGDNINQSDNKNVIFPPILKHFFNESEAERVFRFVDEFMSKNKLKTTEYEYTSLVIYLIIQYTLFSNTNEIVSIQNESDNFESFETETYELSNSFKSQFNYTFTNEQNNFLNNFMILIKSENDRKLIFDNTSEVNRIKQIIIGHDQKANIYDSKFLEGLSKHISLSMKRIRFGMKVINPYTYNFKKSYPVSFEEALRLSERITQNFGITFNDDEIALIGMYYASLSDRKGVVNRKTTVTIVCNTGIGTSRFLEEKILQEMDDVLKIDSIKVTHELSSEKIDSDIIISTVPLSNPPKPYVLVSPFLTKKDRSKIFSLIDNRNSNHLLKQLIDPRLVVLMDYDGEDYKSALLALAERATKCGYTDDEIFDSAITREKLSSTALEGTALPHGTTDHILKPFIGIIKSKQGIEWLGEKVHVAFFMGLKNMDASTMKSIYHELNKVLEDKKIISKIIDSKDVKNLMKEFEED